MSSPSRLQSEMRLTDRCFFARQWLHDAETYQEKRQVFSAFFSGYVALIPASLQLAINHGQNWADSNLVDETGEHKAIGFAMSERSEEIDRFITSEHGKRVTTSLRIRVVPEGDEFKMIGSKGDSELEEAASFLFDLWSPSLYRSKNKAEIKTQADALGIVFRKVRNRLFHGVKLNDPNGFDADLLEHLNPILFGVVEVLVAH